MSGLKRRMVLASPAMEMVSHFFAGRFATLSLSFAWSVMSAADGPWKLTARRSVRLHVLRNVPRV